MMTALREALDTLQVPPTRAGLVEGFALLGRLHAHLTTAAHTFGVSGEWVDDGAYSARNWLQTHARLDTAEASRLLKNGARLAQLPVTTEAAKRGALSKDQVAAITTNLTYDTVPLFADVEGELIPALAEMTVTDAQTTMRYWKQKAASCTPPTDEHGVYLSQHFGGKWALSGDLHADEGRILNAALNAATVTDADGEERTPAQRRSDALTHIARYYLGHIGSANHPVNRPGLVAITTIDQLTAHDNDCGFTLTGEPLTRHDLNRIACDCTLHRMLVAADGTILDFGRGVRTAPPSQRLAVASRDRHCRFPGCSRPVDECDVHHIVHFAHGGRTSLDNEALLCHTHHTVVHKPGWSVAVGDCAELRFTTPAGEVLISHPPPHHPLIRQPAILATSDEPAA